MVQIKHKEQPYQTEAVQARIDVLEDQPTHDNLSYTIDLGTPRTDATGNTELTKASSFIGCGNTQINAVRISRMDCRFTVTTMPIATT